MSTKVKDISYPMLAITASSYSEPQEDRVAARSILTGLLKGTTTISLGDKNIKLDAANRRITISDGTNDRVLIGYDFGGF